MFRKVDLPEGVSGTLYLHSMPGRMEELEDFLKEAKRTCVETIVCLAPEEEIREKSPEYHRSLSSGAFPVPRIEFPIRDFDVPERDRIEGFMNLAAEVSKMLLSGKTVLIHCASGVGRTGTLCTCVLFALGVPGEKAVVATRKAGAEAETVEQKELVLDCYRKLKRQGEGRG